MKLQLLMVKFIQLWMVLTTARAHKNALLTTVTFIQLWMVKVIQLSFMEVNDCHPKMDGQFLDVY